MASVPERGHRTGRTVRPRTARRGRAILGGHGDRLRDTHVGRVRVLPQAILRVRGRAAGRVRQTRQQVLDDGTATRGGDGQGQGVPVPADGRRAFPVGEREENGELPDLTESQISRFRRIRNLVAVVVFFRNRVFRATVVHIAIVYTSFTYQTLFIIASNIKI